MAGASPEHINTIKINIIFGHRRSSGVVDRSSRRRQSSRLADEAGACRHIFLACVLVTSPGHIAMFGCALFADKYHEDWADTTGRCAYSRSK